MSLDDIVAQRHKEIKDLEFSKLLFSGKIDKDLYATYLFNLHPMYDVLEAFGRAFGLLDGAIDYRRGLKINEDFREIWANRGDRPAELKVTERYLKHIKHLADNTPELLAAHLYVRFLELTLDGDELKRKIPGKGLMLSYQDVTALADVIKPKDDLTNEVNVCFDFVKEMFVEIISLEASQDLNKEQASVVNIDTTQG